MHIMTVKDDLWVKLLPLWKYPTNNLIPEGLQYDLIIYKITIYILENIE